MRNIKTFKQSSKKSLIIKRTVLLNTAGMLTIASIVGLSRPSFADSFDDQIKALQSQVDSYNAQSASLHAQADSLANAIAELDAQKSVIQGQINLSQAKHDQLVGQIEETQKKIAATQAILSSTIADMYVDSKTTPLEMVASSNDISSYVNAEQYNNVASQQIQSSINQIKTLKADLETQQKAVDQSLADQNEQRAVLQQKTDQQNSLLAQTQGSEAAYQAMIGQSKASISSLQAQQRAANAALGGKAVAGDPNMGGYPNNLRGAKDSRVDPWGMFNRECVSYTAWKVDQTYGNMPYWGGRGNANEWPSSARNDGIPTGSTPKVGSVAISMNGYYGHSMWVEAVNGSQIYVSQMNYDLAGSYSEMWVNGSNLTYIYFGDK